MIREADAVFSGLGIHGFEVHGAELVNGRPDTGQRVKGFSRLTGEGTIGNVHPHHGGQVSPAEPPMVAMRSGSMESSTAWARM